MPRIRKKKLTSIGITCGIGSMLIGAKKAGFDVLGNVEWRKYYHIADDKGRNTFKKNFPGAVMKYNVNELTEDELSMFTNVDLAMGHPECGCFSQLNPNKEAVHDAADIPLFVDLIAQFRPRYFVMDDLPKSFIAFPMKEYWERLPDYDLFPEWVSNYHYGNPQKQRRRMFMIGALKSERFVFRPGEFDHDLTVEKVIGDLYDREEEVPNHEHHNQQALCAKALHLHYHGHRATWEELAEYVNENRPGQTISYHKADGTIGTRIGTYKGHWDGHAHVMTGGLSALHPLRGNPFSIRERARIQGFPDSFKFYGTVLEEDGQWEHDRNMHMIKQTGKAMPIQFNLFVARQIKAHIEGRPFKEATGERLISPSSYINEAKKDYCRHVGYADQKRACENCWMNQSCEMSLLLPEEEREVPSITKPEPKPKPKPKPELKQPKQKKKSKAVIRGSMHEEVQIDKSRWPEDYHCECDLCSEYLGELVRPDGSYYSRNDRKRYYSKEELASTTEEAGHIAKTPLHVARWAVQQFSSPGDWVFDPTAGAGTTLVEAVTHSRNAAGIEIQTGEIILENCRHAKKVSESPSQYAVIEGDARKIRQLLNDSALPKFELVVNNPPYSGDESQKGLGKKGYEYDRSKDNLAFLNEGPRYYNTLRKIYEECFRRMTPSGHLVIAVKDQMRNKKPDFLHRWLGETILRIEEAAFVGMALLNHYPRTLHLNTYYRRYGVHPPYYQTILVFKKIG